MGKKVMIVDDAKFMRNIISNILVSAGHEVIAECKDGKEALEKYSSLSPRPDLVTMDIVMPGIHGIETIRELMKIDNDARILIVSSLRAEGLIVEGIKAGAKDFIVKPFKQNKILEIVDKVLAS